ncbi:MAG TPA: TonB family protein [Candidatus Binatia bacterium]|nr:TonB family protein [Candidatus Binatia bacterium]
MAQNAEIFFEHENWPRALGWSAGFHLGVAALILISAFVFSGPRGEGWGGGGGGSAIGVTLVSSVPLPATPTQTQNVLANESKGLTKSQPKVEEKEPDAIEIQGKNTKIKPNKPPAPTKETKPVPEQESNQVAYGEGGPVSGPYGSFTAGGAKGGFGISGSGGDFGTRYGWYVQIIQRKISENWLKYEVDPRITSAQRVYITFDVARDGHPYDVRVEQSSGIPSLDISATRALQRIDTFGPLPSDYAGGKISVEYWFDYSKK